MAKVIHKQAIPIEDLFTILLPRFAEVLAFQNQRETPIIWYLFDTDEPEIQRRSFILMNTGTPSDLPLGKYIGTAQFEHGSLIFHLFEDRLDG